MKFSLFVDTHVNKIDVIEEADRLGYDKAWFGDSQMLWSDCYVTMAIAATRTRRIKIGPGVTSPGLRLAAVTACAIGTLNAVAPGRIFLGISTGHTSMRLLGKPPATVQAMSEYITVSRKLLDGDPATLIENGRETQIQFLHRDRYFINLDNRIPIYVAAQGPKAMSVAGGLADGWLTAAGAKPEDTEQSLQVVKQGAVDAGRSLPEDYMVCTLVSPCILQPGERIDSDRVIDQVGVQITTQLHYFYEVWVQSGRQDAAIPEQFADMWEDYVASVEQFAQGARAQKIHDGHSTFLLEHERRFLTPTTIKAGATVGTPDEIAAIFRRYQAAGVNDLCLLPAADVQREVMRDVARQIMPRMAEK